MITAYCNMCNQQVEFNKYIAKYYPVDCFGECNICGAFISNRLHIHHIDAKEVLFLRSRK